MAKREKQNNATTDIDLLHPGQAREHVRYAMSKLVAHFFMDQAAVAAVVRQRGVEVSGRAKSRVVCGDHSEMFKRNPSQPARTG